MTDRLTELEDRLAADEAWWENRAHTWDVRDRVLQQRLEATNAQLRAIGDTLSLLTAHLGVVADRLVDHATNPDAHNQTGE